MNRYTPLIRFAIKYSHLVDVKKAQHFTFIFQGGNLCAWGYNYRVPLRYNSLGFVKQREYSVHSESMAISQLNKNRNLSIRNLKRKSFTVVNIRVTKTGKLKNASPCQECLANLLLEGFKKIYASNNEGEIVRVYV